MLKLADINGLKVTVMGLGLNGGGLATAKFFAQNGAKVTVTDLKTEVELAKSLEALKDISGLRFVLGRHELVDFENADLVIKNPAVKKTGNKFLAVAKKIESDISVFLKFNPAPILAVTGSKGKSSTVSALHYGLRSCGYDAFLGGNITISPLTFLEKLTSKTPVVLELSSFQLADLKDCEYFCPSISILTPIVRDHQNWYTDMESYVADKKVIYQNQQQNNFTICNLDDNWGHIFAKETKAKLAFYSSSYKPLCNDKVQKLSDFSTRVYFSESGEGILKKGKKELLLLPKDTKVLSLPLKQNILNAALAMYLYGVPLGEIPQIMKDYPGLEHRLELFYETDCFDFYNDTTATVPEATISALDAFIENSEFFEKPILLAGGTNKNLNFEQFGKEAKKASSIYLLAGTGTDLMIRELQKNEVEFFGPFDSLKKLLLKLKNTPYKISTKKTPVLFSPAATSFGMFKNEFDRGNQFKQLVKEIF